jgi:hypothetical protein
MMSYLTRPSRQNFANGSPAAEVRKILSNLPKGSEIDRIKLIEDTKVDPSRLTKVLKDFPEKNFTIKKQPSKLEGRRKTLIGNPELDKIAKAAYGKKFDELSDTAKTNINTGKITAESMTPFRRQKILEGNLKELNKRARQYYDKDYLDLDENRKQRVRQERKPVFVSQQAENKVVEFTKNFIKKNKKLPSKKEVIDGANVSWSTVTNAAEKGLIKLDPLSNVATRRQPLNDDLLKLSKNKKVKDALFKGETDKLLKLTKDILKLDDSSIIEARIGQLASAYSGDREVPGITPNKKIEKIIPDLFQGLKNSRRERRRLADLQVGTSVGESTTLAAPRQLATRSYPAIPYDIDEPAGVISSVRRGTTPYAVFAQIIDRNLNQTVKKSYDSIKSKQEKLLQDALATGDKKLIDQSVKQFNDTASKYEKILNKDVKPGNKKIKLFKVSLDKPENTIANYKNLSENYKKAFNDNYNKRGYSFKVPRDIKDAFTIAKELKDPKNVDKVISGAEAGFGRLYSNPFADPSTLGKYGKYALQVAGTPLGVGVLTAGFGVDPSSAIDRATLGAEAAFAPALVKGAQQVATNPLTQRILNLGLSPQMAMRAARIASPLGVASLIGEGGYQLYKAGQAERAKLQAMTPEERAGYLRAQEAENMIAAADGGLIRKGFADGPDDPSKRKFMKIMGGLASLPVVGKFIKIAEPLAPAVSRAFDSMPDFLTDLIAKVKTKAEATGMKFFTGKSADEFADVYKADGYTVTEQGNRVTVTKRKEQGDMLEKDMEMELEVDPETGGMTYKEATARPDAEGKLKDVEEYIDDIDLEEMKKYTYDE